jgi:3-hydroxyisobutyrate dehydrogenase-like beta-hydroxyacid dehydrogenase
MNVGFVGLGAMGAGIVRRLLAAGRPVTGWNRTKTKADPLLHAGMAWADTPRELASASDVVISMLTNTTAVRAVVLGNEGILSGLKPGSVYIDMSTISPATSRELAAAISEAGSTMLDAPVSGSMATLERGELSIMVGGDESSFEKVRPLLLEMGTKVTHVGGNGQALAMKLAINLSLVVQIISFCESIALAEKSGIARETAVDAILKSVIASPVVAYRAPLILEDHEGDAVFADVELQQKDQLLGLSLARELETPMPLAALANEWLTATRAAGLGDRDFVAAHQVFRALGGMR